MQLFVYLSYTLDEINPANPLVDLLRPNLILHGAILVLVQQIPLVDPLPRPFLIPLVISGYWVQKVLDAVSMRFI